MIISPGPRGAAEDGTALVGDALGRALGEMLGTVGEMNAEDGAGETVGDGLTGAALLGLTLEGRMLDGARLLGATETTGLDAA